MIILGVTLAVPGTIVAFSEWPAAVIIVAPALFVAALRIGQFYRTYRRK